MRLQTAALCLLLLRLVSQAAAGRIVLQDKAARQASKPNSAASGTLDRVTAFTQLPIGPKLDSKYYSGFITLDASKGRKFFYVFGEAQKDPQNKPLLFWMNGGPGCSSVGLGWLQGNGPLIPVSGSAKVAANKHSFTNIANVLWVEQPTFTGFSTSNDKSEWISDDSTTSQNMLNFLLVWYERFPQYKGNKLFLAGQSYAGHYGPLLAKRILEYNEGVNKKVVSESNRQDFKINLAGIAMGNAWTDPFYDNKGRIDFWYGRGLISRDIYNGLNKCDLTSGALWRTQGPSGFTPECQKLRDQAYAQIGKINQYGLNAPICMGANKKYPVADPENEGFQMWDPCAASQVIPEVMNMRDVQLAMGAITPSEPTKEWTPCTGSNLTYSVKDMTTSMIPVYRQLLNKGLPVMVYSGETDAYVPLVGTRAWVESMKLPLVDPAVPMRQWANAATEQLGGSVMEYKGLTLVSVKNAGHSLGSWQPAKNVQIMGAFLNGQKLPTFTYT